MNKLSRWVENQESKTDKYKKIWRELKVRDKIIVAGLLIVGVCQMMVGLAMIAAVLG